MSPGLMALPPGMFSVAGTTPTTLSGSFISAIAFIVPSTLAAPHMSYFISSISAAGLMRDAAGVEGDALADERHGGRVLLAAVVLHDDELRRLRLPCATARKQPMPSFSHVLALQDLRP